MFLTSMFPSLSLFPSIKSINMFSKMKEKARNLD